MNEDIVVQRYWKHDGVDEVVAIRPLANNT